MLSKNIWMLLLAICVARVSYAQDVISRAVEPGNYKYNSYRQLAQLHKKFGLDTVQYKRVEKALLSFYQGITMLPMSDDSLSVRGQRLQVLQSDLINNLKQILTPAQFEQYQQEVEGVKRRRKPGSRN